MTPITQQTEDPKTKKLNKRQRYKRNKKVKKANALKVFLLADVGFKYLVRGENEHRVKITRDGKIADCDCSNGNAPCSHVIAVRMFRGEWK